MMFEAAVVAWLVALIGDRGVKGITRAIFGTPQEHALRAAMKVAATPVIASVPPQSRAGLTDELRECFTKPPAAVLDGLTPVRAGLVAAIRAQLAPLADPHMIETGKSYFEIAGIDPVEFIDQFTLVLLTSIHKVGSSDSALAPLAAQLNADESHEMEGAILAKVNLTLSTVQEILRAPDRRSARQGVARPRLEKRPSAPWRLPPDAIDRLADSMLDIPSVINDNARNVIQDMLEVEMEGGISQHIIPRLQVVTWLQECPNHEGGVSRLVSIIRLVEGNSRAMRRLDEAILEIGGQIATGSEPVPGEGKFDV
jgi:hypothetical protein